MIKKLLARFLRKEPSPDLTYKPQSRGKFDAKFHEGVKALPDQKPDMCVGCQQAAQRINTGARTTMCHICGCYWISQAASIEFIRPTSYRKVSQEDVNGPNYFANKVDEWLAKMLPAVAAMKAEMQEEFDAKFYEDVKPYRECAKKAGCDMALFDMEVACRKARVDEFRANAQHFYPQHPGTPSGTPSGK